MTRGILIAGNESALSAAIAAEAAKRVDRLAVAFIPSGIPGAVRENPPPPEGAAYTPLNWNPGSPVSTRSLVLAAENHLGHIDEAVLVCAPPSVRKPADALIPAEIEVMVNDHMKGWFFLVKELSALFKARKTGTLALVLSDISPGGGRDDEVDLMGPSVTSSFRAFTQGLLAASFREPYQVLGFSASDAGEDGDFAAFIFKVMEEGGKRNAGKWHKYGKLPFFGR
jgi:NAD(P)-dependent dehydrogenase (short-subunit alcohol dehydrogenase family)